MPDGVVSVGGEYSDELLVHDLAGLREAVHSSYYFGEDALRNF